MSEYEFWRETPKRIILKARIYARFKNQNDDSNEAKFGYIDEIF